MYIIILCTQPEGRKVPSRHLILSPPEQGGGCIHPINDTTIYRIIIYSYIIMPFRKRKRRVKRRVKRRSPTASYHMAFPQTRKVWLKYHDNVLNNPNGIVHNNTFNINSIYSPQVSGGHQPLFHDQLAEMYNRYRVRFMRYTIIISGLSTAARYALTITNNDPPATYGIATEQIGAKVGIVNKMADGGKNTVRLTGLVDLRKVIGETLDDDRDQAVFGASPANLAKLRINYESLDESTSMTQVNTDVILIYYCEVFDNVVVSLS